MGENAAGTNEPENKNRTLRLGELAERDFDLIFLLRQYDETGRDKPDVWLTMIQERLDCQVIRRIYVRLLMSFVESVIATLKSELADDIYELTPAETAALTDTAYDVTEQGEAIERPAFVPIHKKSLLDRLRRVGSADSKRIVVTEGRAVARNLLLMR